MAEKKRKKNWIRKAVPKSREGVFTKKAEAAGKSVQEYAREKKDAPGALGKQARLAINFSNMAKERKRAPIHDRKRD